MNLNQLYGSESNPDPFETFDPAIYIGGTLIDGTPVVADALYAYWETLSKHIYYVRVAGLQLGLPMSHMAQHDLSKLSPIEFPAAAMHYQGGGAPVAYSYAWHNHFHKNPHHPNHWVFPGTYHLPDSGMDGQCLEMPEIYATEMISDWQGSNQAYLDTWDMTPWLIEHLPRMVMHHKTKKFVAGILDKLGYYEVLKGAGWA